MSKSGIFGYFILKGWVRATPEQQPYMLDISQRLMPRLVEAGFIEARSFEFSTATQAVTTNIGGVACDVQTYFLGESSVPAADRPEDMIGAIPRILPVVIECLRQHASTHVLSVVVSRLSVGNLLSPTAMIAVTAAKSGVEPEPESKSSGFLTKEMYEGFGFGQPDLSAYKGVDVGIGSTARKLGL